MTGSCIPHMRGDGPVLRGLIRGSYEYSPHAWGWSGAEGVAGVGGGVFPTCVGMVSGRIIPRPVPGLSFFGGKG